MFPLTQLDTGHVLLDHRRGLFVMGLGMGATMMPLFTSALKTLTNHEVARGSTLLNISQQIASSVGVAVMSVILTNHLKDGKFATAAIGSVTNPSIIDKIWREQHRQGLRGSSELVQRDVLGGLGHGALDGDPGDVPAAQARGVTPARRRGGRTAGADAMSVSSR